MSYEWLKIIHIIGVISWMAGLLYLPRLFVYHAGATAGSEMSEAFKVMERRLFRFIMTPAMIVSWIFGLWLMMTLGAHQQGWMHAKLTLVLVLTGFHHLLLFHIKRFARDANTHTARYFKWLNEAPTVLMIGAVILVVLKPF